MSVYENLQTIFNQANFNQCTFVIFIYFRWLTITIDFLTTKHLTFIGLFFFTILVPNKSIIIIVNIVFKKHFDVVQ